MTNIENFTESYKKFYDSYSEVLERIYIEDGYFELSQEDSIWEFDRSSSDWVVEKLKDDPYGNVLLQCQNDITVEIYQKLKSKYPNCE